jgi:CheY-like chemotaxis protein
MTSPIVGEHQLVRSSRSNRGLIILLLEDSPDDLFFLQRALDQRAIGHVLRVVMDGEEGMAYLRAEGQYADRQAFPIPDIILTDLKMPKIDGFEFLEWLRDQAEFCIIPTIVLSSSDIEPDVKRAYQLGANAFVRKPAELEELSNIIQTVCEFWSCCKLPMVPKKWGA